MFCFSCSCSLSERRYNLSSPSHTRQLFVWKTLAMSRFDELGSDINIDALLLMEGAGRVCSKCLSDLEKLERLQSSLKSKMVCSVSAIINDERFSSCNQSQNSLPFFSTPTPSTSFVSDDASTSISMSDIPHPHTRTHRSSTPESLNVAVITRKGKKRASLRNISTPTRKKAISSFSRGNDMAAIKQCFQNEKIRPFIIRLVGIITRKEIKKLSSSDSILKRTSPDDLKQFKWDSMYHELRDKAPFFLGILEAATKTKAQRSNRNAVICLCTAILLKYRYQELNAVQKIISLILYLGHASKEVFSRLRPFELVVCRSTLISLVDTFGEDHDLLVKTWHKNITETLCPVDASTMQGILEPVTMSMEDDDCEDNDEEDDDEEYDELEFDETSDYDEYELENEDALSVIDDDEDESLSGVSYASSNDLDDDEIEPPPYSPVEKEADLELMETGMDNSLNLSHCNLMYKLVGDNVHKNVNPRYRRTDHKTKSLHYYHSYAILDRINVSDLSRAIPSYLPPSNNRAESLLPTAMDDQVLRSNIKILFARILSSTLPWFNALFSHLIVNHIPHKRTKEMSKKSCIVPLGVLPKDENKVKEMTEILGHLHQYVPQVEYSKTEIVSGASIEVVTAVSQTVLLGGDQLSQARARTALKVKKNGESPSSRLEGFLLTIEDWHTKLTLYEVIWKYFMSDKSAAEHGTLYHIRNVLGRSDVGKPKAKLNSCEDFMAIVMHSYITSATMEVLGLESIEDWPSSIPDNIWTEGDDELRQQMDLILNKVVDTYTSIEFNSLYKTTKDHASEYIKQLMSIGSLVMEFVDAIKEGDGVRVLRCWRYFLVIFRNSHRTNYAKEAVLLIHQYQYLLSPELAERLIYSRFVNTAGLIGRNISADLHMEHLNRLLKNGIATLASNKTEASIIRLGKALGTIGPVLENYDAINDINHHCTRHKPAEFKRDVHKVIDLLKPLKLFQNKSNRKFNTFPNPKSLLHKSSMKDLTDWIKTHI